LQKASKDLHQARLVILVRSGIKKKSFAEYCEMWQTGFFGIVFDAGR